jgi:carboxylate/amino acid/amine transporter
VLYLVAVTILWAFSFSLIGEYLSGNVDAYFSVLSRIMLAAAVFLPFLKVRLLTLYQTLTLVLLGALQLGVMYIFFYHSFLFLSVPEVLLFTIFTPLYVAILDDALFKRFSVVHLLCAVIATAGAAIIRFDELGGNFWFGFSIVQGANMCFACGQVGYRKLASTFERPIPNHNIFAWFFIGALIVALPAYLLFGDKALLPTTYTQWGVLFWLGVVASGLGYYFWNTGALKVDAGVLATMNNALIPTGLLVNMLIWQKDVDITKLIIGGLVITFALWCSQRFAKPVNAVNADID